MTYLNIIEPDSCWPWKCCHPVIKDNDDVYIRADSSVVKFDYRKHEPKSLSKCLERINQVFLQQVGQKVFLGQYISRIAVESGISEGRFYLMSKPFTRAEMESIKTAMANLKSTRLVTIPAVVVAPVLSDMYVD